MSGEPVRINRLQETPLGAGRREGHEATKDERERRRVKERRQCADGADDEEPRDGAAGGQTPSSGPRDRRRCDKEPDLLGGADRRLPSRR